MGTSYVALPVESAGEQSAVASPSTEPGPFGRLMRVGSTPLARAAADWRLRAARTDANGTKRAARMRTSGKNGAGATSRRSNAPQTFDDSERRARREGRRAGNRSCAESDAKRLR